TKRSGVPCRAGILTSDYWHSARPRAGSRPSPPPRVSFLQVKGSPVQIRPSKAGPGQQQPQRGGADQRLPLCPAWSSPPCDVDRTGLPMLIATADGQYADLPTGGHSAAVAIVTDGDNLHRVAPVYPATDRLIHR